MVMSAEGEPQVGSLWLLPSRGRPALPTGSMERRVAGGNCLIHAFTTLLPDSAGTPKGGCSPVSESLEKYAVYLEVFSDTK